MTKNRLGDTERLLMERAQEIDAARKAGAKGDRLAVLVEGIMDAMRTHFAEENLMMDNARYPLRAEHRRAHLALQAAIVGLLQTIRMGLPAAEGDAQALKTLLVKHFRDHDAKLHAYLVANS